MSSLRLVFLNVMMPVPKPLRFIAQDERLDQIAKWISDYHHDVDGYIFAELIQPAQEATLRKTLLSLGFIHYTQQRINIYTVRSGVVIYSRYPILATNDISYQTDCEGSDCLADKNMLYAQLDLRGVSAHVFMTHLHAWSTPLSKSVRTEQLRQLRQFIDLHHIPCNELITVIGDFNIDNDQNQEILDVLHATNIPLLSTQDTTMDPQLNPLVGLDNIEYYTNEQYPNGCVKEYWSQHICVCCPRSWIDYGVLIKNQVVPTHMSQSIIVPNVPEYTVPLGLLQTEWKLVNTVSDHFPIQIYISWESTPSLPQIISPKVQMNHHWTWCTSYTWTSLLCVGVLLVWLIVIMLILPRHFAKVCACQTQKIK